MVAIELETGGVVWRAVHGGGHTVAAAAWPTRQIGTSSRRRILLRPCGSVHTMFMRFPIDVVFCDRDLRVLSVGSDVRPWRMRAQRGAHVVIELSAGEASRRGVSAGSQLRVAQ